MRFSSSLVAFAYLGFAAALVLPVVPQPTTTISTTALPKRTPDLGARDGIKLPGTGSIPPTTLPSSAPTIPGGTGGKGDKKGGTIARRGVPGVGKGIGPSVPPVPSSSLPVPSLSTSLPIPIPSVPA